MYIIDIIPLAFIPRNQAQILSYFHKEPLNRGAVVEVLLGRRKIKGVVAGFDTVKNRKFAFRKSVDFSLKNIGTVIEPEPSVTEGQFKMAKYISDYYYAPLGVCLKTVLPPFWGKKNYKLEIVNHENESLKFMNPNSRFIKTNLKKHYLDYEDDLKKTLKQGHQVFLMVAEQTAGKYFLDKYKKLNPIYISSNLSSKNHYELWQSVQSGKSQLIIGTRIGLFLPFNDLKLIIVDDESHEFYKSDMMPRYNGAMVAEFLAGLFGANIIKSAIVPRVENYESKINDIKLNSLKTKTIIADMVHEIKSGNFSIFSRDLKEEMMDSVSRGENIILYIPRRGYSNFLYCEKCSHIVKCPNCTASLILHKQIVGGEIIDSLWCHKCGYKTPKLKSCNNCGSYKLKPHGAGVERVVSDIKKFFDYQNLTVPPIFCLDSDTTKNDDKKELEIIDNFFAGSRSAHEGKKEKGSILVATQVLFSHKYYLDKIALAGIINADTLINIPDFRAEESLFRQIYTLKNLTPKLIVQTHNPENPTLKYIMDGDMSGFIKEEFENRKVFSYPPFSQIVKLTFKHRDRNKARSESYVLAEKFKQIMRREQYPAIISGPSPAFISRERGMYVWNIILKIKNPPKISDFEKIKRVRERNEFLRLVPNGWLVEADPTSTI